MPKYIETQRLILRPITSEDFDFLRSLHGNPDVMKFIGNGGPRTETQTREALSKYLAMEESNPILGGWVATIKHTNEKIGNLLIRLPATNEEMDGYEIGYMFNEVAWGKGFATEGSKAIIDYAYRELGQVDIIALINPQNDGSRKTLHKLGFKECGFTDYVDPTTGNKIETEVLKITN